MEGLDVLLAVSIYLFMAFSSSCVFSESTYCLALYIQKKKHKQKEVDVNGNVLPILLNIGTH